MGVTTQRGPNINVTPLIDVLLVLIVIFLIILPKVVQTEQVAIPPDDGDVEPLPTLVIVVKADLSIVIFDEDQEIPLTAGELPAGLRAHLRDNTHAVFVEFEDAVLWNEVVSTIDTIRGVAPETQVALKVRD